MKPAELFETDLESFKYKAARERVLASYKRSVAEKLATAGVSEQVSRILMRCGHVAADRHEMSATIMERAAEGQNEQDMEQALIVLHRDLACAVTD